MVIMMMIITATMITISLILTWTSISVSNIYYVTKSIHEINNITHVEARL